MEFTINTDDKPHLTKMMKENPQLAKEIIGTFVSLMEESCDTTKGISWAELPKRLNPNLDFGMLVRGIIRGSLDLKAYSDSFDVLQEEVHPLAFLAARNDPLGGVRYWNWRNHFRLPQDQPINADAIAKMVRTFWQYGRYLDLETLQKAIQANQVATFRGLDQAKLLPFYPALRYQQEHFGELHVGKFFDEIGAFDAGELVGDDEQSCHACNRPDLFEIGCYKVCASCNAGYKVVHLEENL